MLILSRRNFESVVIGDPGGDPEQMLKVTVLSIVAGKVRLGFDVARGIPVHRLEVWERARANGSDDTPTEDPATPRV